MAKSTTTFKCHHYLLSKTKSTEISFDTLLSSLNTKTYSDRLVELPNGKEIRLERIEQNGAYFYFEFIDRKFKGLGSAKADEKAKSIKLDRGALFTDSTACVYCPKTNKVAIEYNHLGVRYSDIEAYANNSLEMNQAFTLSPQFINELDRVIKYGIKFKRLTFKGRVDELRKIESNDFALTSAIASAEDNDAEYICVDLSVRSSKSKLNLEKIKSLLSSFSKNSDSIKMLKAKGSYDSSEDFNLNLLDGIIEYYNAPGIAIADGSVPIKTRYELLERAIKQWNTSA